MREGSLRVTNRDRGTILGDRIAVAESWWGRLRGAWGRLPLAPGSGLLLRPCRAVHMIGLRHPLDIAFVDRGGRVVAIYATLRPGRITGYHRSADAALELPPGTLAASATTVGDRLELTRGLLAAG